MQLKPASRVSGTSASLLRRIATDLAVWFLAPAVFLLVYVFYCGIPSTAVLPHLHLVLISYVSLAIVRITLHVSVPGERAAKWISALVMASAIAIMLAYYALVIIGLQTWGRVISWDLITSYGRQVVPLADALGISLVVVLGIVLFAYGLLLAAIAAYLKRCDFTPRIRDCLSAPALSALLGGTAIICAVQLYTFMAAPPAAASEPLSLTFMPLQKVQGLQGYDIDQLRVEKLDALEDAARAEYQPPRRAEHKNVVLIVVDALRPDHMGLYGYERDTTPHLSRIARSSALRTADVVRASCSASACGLASLLSSKYIHQFSYRPFTLHQVLQRNGYRVRLILGGDHLNFYGLKEFYGRVDDYFDASMAPERYPNDDEIVLERARSLPAWDGVPEVIQFHLMSAHPAGKRQPEFARFLPAVNYYLYHNRNSRDAPRATNYYDNGVVQADAMINELLEMLRSKGYLQNTVVAITADHGELLGERGVYLHGNSVDEEVLRIPLLLLAYGYESESFAEKKVIGAQVDIAPTILTELGLPVPRTWSGVSLQHAIGRDYTYFQDRDAAGFVDHRHSGEIWKYWVTKSGEEHALNLSGAWKSQLNAIAYAPSSRREQWKLQYLQVLASSTGAQNHNTKSETHAVAVQSARPH
jgi:glucan phosphoethanolaminetransferase (alkaline phosphatase superfamily)